MGMGMKLLLLIDLIFIYATVQHVQMRAYCTDHVLSILCVHLLDRGYFFYNSYLLLCHFENPDITGVLYESLNNSTSIIFLRSQKNPDPYNQRCLSTPQSVNPFVTRFRQQLLR